jgi:hypothetical protein
MILAAQPVGDFPDFSSDLFMLFGKQGVPQFRSCAASCLDSGRKSLAQFDRLKEWDMGFLGPGG